MAEFIERDAALALLKDDREVCADSKKPKSGRACRSGSVESRRIIMPKKGDKYIIELGDEITFCNDGEQRLRTIYMIKGFNALVFDEICLSKLQPFGKLLDETYQSGYDAGKEDVRCGYKMLSDQERAIGFQEGHDVGFDEGYSEGMNDAWGAARRISASGRPGESVQEDVFGNWTIEAIFRYHSASEAIEKLRAYDESKNPGKELVTKEDLEKKKQSKHGTGGQTMYEVLISHLRDCARHDPYENTFTEAADAIEELICEVADKHNALLDAEERQRWIPVTERLPKKPKNYPNCKLREYYFLVTLETNAVVCREYDFDNKRWHGTNGTIRVTHWMQLPQPPKEEEK